MDASAIFRCGYNGVRSRFRANLSLIVSGGQQRALSSHQSLPKNPTQEQQLQYLQDQRRATIDTANRLFDEAESEVINHQPNQPYYNDGGFDPNQTSSIAPMSPSYGSGNYGFEGAQHQSTFGGYHSPVGGNTYQHGTGYGGTVTSPQVIGNTGTVIFGNIPPAANPPNNGGTVVNEPPSEESFVERVLRITNEFFWTFCDYVRGLIEQLYVLGSAFVAGALLFVLGIASGPVAAVAGVAVGLGVYTYQKYVR